MVFKRRPWTHIKLILLGGSFRMKWKQRYKPKKKKKHEAAGKEVRTTTRCHFSRLSAGKWCVFRWMRKEKMKVDGYIHTKLFIYRERVSWRRSELMNMKALKLKFVFMERFMDCERYTRPTLKFAELTKYMSSPLTFIVKQKEYIIYLWFTPP